MSSAAVLSFTSVRTSPCRPPRTEAWHGAYTRLLCDAGKDASLHLTKMAGGSELETNEDVGRLTVVVHLDPKLVVARGSRCMVPRPSTS